MRLIDADLFLEFINAEMKQNRPDDLHIRNITRVLEDLPTAFDVDKVVEQLEKEIKENPYQSEYLAGLYKAIEIVKAGEV